MSKLTASAAGGAMPAEGHKTRKPLPAFESYLYLTCFQFCHFRLQALHRIAEGREDPKDRSMISGAESLLAMKGWTPKDFGFVDPPTFELKANVGTVFAAQEAALN
jgi:hypothetical protein